MKRERIRSPEFRAFEIFCDKFREEIIKYNLANKDPGDPLVLDLEYLTQTMSDLYSRLENGENVLWKEIAEFQGRANCFILELKIL